MTTKIKLYPRYRPSGIEWLGGVPEHWEIKKLKHLGEAIIGLTYDPSNVVFEDQGLLVLRASNVSGGKIVLNNNVYVDSKIPEDLITKVGDILLCSRSGSRALIGKCALIDDQSKGLTFGAFMTTFRSDLNSYLFFIFSSRLFESQTAMFFTSTINQLTTGDLKNMIVPLPPRSELSNIENFLIQTTTKLDALIAQKQQLIELIKEKRQALVTRAVTKGLNPKVKMKVSGVAWLGQIPEHWDEKKLKHKLLPGNKGIKIGPFGSALTYEQIVDNGPFKVYGQENVIYRDIEAGNRYLTTEKFTELKAYEIKGGDILITMMGTTGSCITVPENADPGIMDSHLLRMRFGADVLPEFVELLLDEAQYVKKQIDYLSKGSIMQGLNSEIVKSFRLVMPPFAEQVEIMTSLKKSISEFETLTKQTEMSLDLLIEYRQSIITAAVTGKIDLREWKTA